MTIERGHQSIYFRDVETLKGLEDLTEEKVLDGKVSVSAVVNEVMTKALPDIQKAVKRGKRTGISLSFTVDL